MKIPFNHIQEKLQKDPFFELRTLGKNTIREHTLPVHRYGEAPSCFRFFDWTEEDDSETIQYAFHTTEIGKLLIANTSKGICFLGFAREDEATLLEDFASRFPKHTLKEERSHFQQLAADYCNGPNEGSIPLHLKGTPFQLGIWRQLVRIPAGQLSTYGSLSDDPGAAQAVGSAVGANPVSYIIPCHRIVKSDGNIQGYHWGMEVKKQLLAYELQQEVER